MRELILAVAVGEGVDPQSELVQAAADSAAARVASAWTTPVYLDDTDGADEGLALTPGARLARYRCMAEPKQ